jgi:hypothetical protein
LNLHPLPGSAFELRIAPSFVINSSFFSIEFSNAPWDEFPLLRLHGRGAPGIVVEISIDVNAVAGAIEVPVQLPRQEFPIRTDHFTPANVLACHFPAVTSDPIVFLAISVRLRLKNPPRETRPCDLGWITVPAAFFLRFRRFFCLQRSFSEFLGKFSGASIF